MGVYGKTDLSASPWQMSVIPEGTAAVGKVIIQTFWSYGCWFAYAAGFSDL